MQRALTVQRGHCTVAAVISFVAILAASKQPLVGTFQHHAACLGHAGCCVVVMQWTRQPLSLQ